MDLDVESEQMSEHDVFFCVGERSDNMVALGDEFSNVKIHRFLEGDVVFAQKETSKKKKT